MIKRERKKHLDIRGWLGNGEDVDGLKSIKCWLYFILFWQEMDAMWSGAYIFSCFICSRHGGTWEILVQNANRERFIHNEHAAKSLEHDHRDLQKKGGERGKEMPVYDTYCHLPLPPLQQPATDWKARTGFPRLHPVFSSQYINVPHQSSHIFI